MAGYIPKRALCAALLLCLCGLAKAAAQRPLDGAGELSAGFELGQNYPNPVNRETRIPFELGESLFEEGRPVAVSIRIYNVLQQFVGAPTALRHPEGAGLPLLQLEYGSPGRYEAHWNGTDRSGQPVGSGVYFVQMRVDGREPAIRRMFVRR